VSSFCSLALLPPCEGVPEYAPNPVVKRVPLNALQSGLTLDSKPGSWQSWDSSVSLTPARQTPTQSQRMCCNRF
jgi:hypothetical protein